MLKIKMFSLGMLGANCYLVSNGSDAVIIDPASYSEEVCKYINDNDLCLRAILLTHAHFDHSLGSPEFASRFNIAVYVGSSDEEMLFNPAIDASDMINLKYKINDMPKIQKVSDNDILSFGSLNLKVIATPGHTKGGVCYYIKEDNVLFSGDTLFLQSVGRTDFYGGSFTHLKQSIQTKLYTLPDETEVYSGHSAPTTIGYEKVHNSIVYSE